jgi:hypothetical protein
LSEDGHVEPEQQQDEDVGNKPVQYCRERYSIFIEPHLKSEKGYFRLRIAIHQFSMDLGLGPDAIGGRSVELGYMLKTSEDKEEIISFSDIVTFSDKAEDSLILYVNLTLSC